MGRNGVGKTTLLKAIMGLLRAARAAVQLRRARRHARWPTDGRARAGIGYVPQGRDIFPYLTVRENLLVGAARASGRRRRLSTRSSTLFPGAGGAPGQAQAGVLSGGQQQQLAIARALLRRPRCCCSTSPPRASSPRSSSRSRT